MQDEAKHTMYSDGSFPPAGRKDSPCREQGWRLIVAGTWWPSLSALCKYWQCDNTPAWAEAAVTSALIRPWTFMLSLRLSLSLSFSHTHTHTHTTFTSPCANFTRHKDLLGVKWMKARSLLRLTFEGNNFVRWCFTTWWWFVILLSLSVHLAWAVGVTSSPQISCSLRADNSRSECYLLQDEATLIAHTCDPCPHKSITGLIYSISIGTTPLLSTSSFSLRWWIAIKCSL